MTKDQIKKLLANLTSFQAAKDGNNNTYLTITEQLVVITTIELVRRYIRDLNWESKDVD